MSALRRSEDLLSLKTRRIVIQNEDSSYPPAGAVLTMDSKGRGGTILTQDLSLNSITLLGDVSAGVLTYSDASGLLMNSEPIGSLLTNLVVTGTSILGTSAVVMGPLTANSVNALVSLTTPNGYITNLDVSNATIDTLTSSTIEAETINVSNGNITALDVSSADIIVLDVSAANVRQLDASSADIIVLDVSAASIHSLDASYANITILDVSAASIHSLDASNATIRILDVSAASIHSLDASYANITILDVSAASIHSLDASYATITALDASAASVHHIDASSANINSLDVSVGVITSHGVPITVPTGCITMYGGTDDFIPNGWIICDGRAISRNDYPALFNTIGTNYGSGDGTTTFNIPNMRSRFPMGVGVGYSLGSSGGNTTKTLGVTEIPAHTHDVASSTTGAGGTHSHSVTGSTDAVSDHNHTFTITPDNTSNSGGDTTNAKWGSGNNNNFPAGSYNGNTGFAGGHSHTISGTAAAVGDHTHTIPGSTTTSVGGGAAFSILPPFLVLNFIIKY